MVSDIVLVAIITAIPSMAAVVVSLITKNKVDKVHKEMNGMKDALVKGAGELGKEQGKAEATAEAKIEIDKLNKDFKP